MKNDPLLMDEISRIEAAIRSKTGGLIRGLKVTAYRDRIIMTGSTDWYYHKQLATQAVQESLRDQEFDNNITVEST